MNDWQIGLELMRRNLPLVPDEPVKGSTARAQTAEDEVLWRRMVKDGYTVTSIAKLTGQSASRISRAVRGR